MSKVPLLVALAVLVVVGAAAWLLLDDGGEGERAELVRSVADGAPRAHVAAHAAPPEERLAARAGELVLPPVAREDDPVAAAHAAGRPAAGAHVTGVLVDADGAPVAGEPVDLFVLDDPWEARARDDDELRAPEPLARAVSAADGRFALAARAGTAHALLAGGRRFARRALPDVRAGDELRVPLEAAHAVRGTVLDADGVPVPGARVAVLGEPQPTLAVADDDGRFELSPLAAAPVRVFGWREGFGVGALDDVVPDGDEVALELPWTRDLVVRVVVRDSDEPVAGARVDLALDVLARAAGSADPLPELHALATLSAVTADDGRAVLPGAPSVGFALAVDAEGYFPAETDKHRLRPVRDDEEVVVWMRPLGTLAVRTLDGETDAPLGDVAVSLLDDAGRVQLATRSDAEGLATFTLDAWSGSGRPEVFAEDDAGRTARVRPGRDELDDGSELVLPLRVPVALRVQVVDAGEPVEGAEVCVRSGGGARTLGATDAGGFASLVHRLQGDQGDGVRVDARHDERESLPLFVALDEERDPDEPLVLDLAGGLFVDGLVLDVAGQPVGGARVSGHGYADPDGRFSAGPFEEGDRPRLVVSADGLRTTTLRTDVPATDLVVTLEPVVTWEGRVRDAVSGLPLDDFVVRLERETTRDGELGFHDAGARVRRDPLDPGAFSVELPDEGRFRLRVGARDKLATTTFPVDFDGRRAPTFADVRLSPAAVLLVTLLDGSGRPVRGVGLSVFDWEATQQAARARKKAGALGTQRTDDDGRARFPLGAGGSFRVAAGRGGWLDDRRLDVVPGPPQERTYRLGPTGDVVLRVTDAQGIPVGRARVTLRSSGREGPSVHRTLHPEDALDELRIEGLPPGTYALELRHRELSAPEREVVVGPLRTTFVDVVMTEGGGGGRGGDHGGGGRGAAPSDAPKAKDKGGKGKAGAGDRH